MFQAHASRESGYGGGRGHGGHGEVSQHGGAAGFGGVLVLGVAVMPKTSKTKKEVDQL